MDKASTKDIITKCLHARISGNNAQIKEAVTYLSEIEKNIYNIPLCVEIFVETPETDTQLLLQSSTIIYSLMKKHMLTLRDKNNAQIFNDLKALIFRDVFSKYFKIANKHNLLNKNLCDYISILVLTGIESHWDTCVEDLVQNARLSEEYELISLRALADIDALISFAKDEDEVMPFEAKIKIKDKLFGKSLVISTFIEGVLKTVSDVKNLSLKQSIFGAVIDLTKTWAQLNINIFKNKNIYTQILNCITNDYITGANIQQISDMFCQAIKDSDNFRVYESCAPYDASEGGYAAVKKEISAAKNKEELDGILFLLEQLIYFLNTSDDIKPGVLFAFTEILATFIENYIEMLFNKDTHSQQLLLLFQKLITSGSRKISCKFFESLDSFREFVDAYYKFEDLSPQEKQQMLQYLIQILVGILKNCRLKKVNNSYNLLVKEIILKNSWDDESASSKYSLDDDEDDLNDMSVYEYRTNSESAIYNIYQLFLNNYGDAATSEFFSLFNGLNINVESPSDEDVLNIDMMLFALTYIIDSFEGVEEELIRVSVNNINNIIVKFIGSSLVSVDLIKVDVLLLLDKFGKYINKEYIKNITMYLLNLAHVNDTQNKNNLILIESIYTILYDVLTFQVLDKESLNLINNRYQEIYYKFAFPNIQPINLCVKSLLTVLNKKNNISNSDLQLIVDQISKPANDSILNFEGVKSSVKNEGDLFVLKKQLAKDFSIVSLIFDNVNNYDSELAVYYIKNHLKNTLRVVQSIFSSNFEEEFLNIIIGFYSSCSYIIGEHCAEYAKPLNEIIVNYYKANAYNYKCVELLKNIYNTLLRNENEDKLYNDYIIGNFIALTNALIGNINQQYQQCCNKFNNNIVDKLIALADFVYLIFPKFDFAANFSSEMQQNICLILNVLDSTLQSLYQTQFQIQQILLQKYIGAYKVILSNKYPIEGFIMQFYDNILRSVFSAVSFKQFNSQARQEFIYCFIDAFHVSECAFIAPFVNLLSKTNKFNAQTVESIVEFVRTFSQEETKLADVFGKIAEIVGDLRGTDALHFNFIQTSRAKIKNKKK